MEIIKFIKEWTLPCAMVFGACVYLLFTEIPMLVPYGEVAGPWFIEILPVLIFMTLYVTFCKSGCTTCASARGMYGCRLYAWLWLPCWWWPSS